MKRLLEKIFDWIEDYGTVTISIFLGIIYGVLVFVDAAFIPVSSSDYEMLYANSEELNSLEKLCEMVSGNKCYIISENNSETLKVGFANFKCRLLVEYNKNFEPISVFEEESRGPWLLALLRGIILGFEIFVISYLILFVIILVISSVHLKILEKSLGK